MTSILRKDSTSPVSHPMSSSHSRHLAGSPQPLSFRPAWRSCCRRVKGRGVKGTGATSNTWGGSENSGFFPPNHPLKNRVFHYKSSILEYPYFWKHPPPVSPHDIPVSTTSHLKQPTSTPLQHNMLKVPGKVTCSKLWL